MAQPIICHDDGCDLDSAVLITFRDEQMGAEPGTTFGFCPLHWVGFCAGMLAAFEDETATGADDGSGTEDVPGSSEPLTPQVTPDDPGAVEGNTDDAPGKAGPKSNGRKGAPVAENDSEKVSTSTSATDE